jgi:hypothetical protein
MILRKSGVETNYRISELKEAEILAGKTSCI